MGSYCNEDKGIIYLFAGIDGENNCNQFYKIELLDSIEVPDEKNKNLKKIKKFMKKKFLVEIGNETLSFNGSFNNNVNCIQNNYLLLIDNKNNVIEFNLDNKECFIYDK